MIVIGGGPIGLLLGNLLGHGRIRTLLVEQTSSPPHQSMAIGITPPSLELLAQINLAETFIRAGVRVNRACVHEEKAPIGELHFNSLAGDYPFILSLPQAKTIGLLEQRLHQQDSVTLWRNTRFLHAEQEPDKVLVSLSSTDHVSQQLTARVLVGCDGHRSPVRRSAGIPCSNITTYLPRFVMADFLDNTDLGNQAHLYFSRVGSLESFPLPNLQRRWILQLDPGLESATAEDLLAGIEQRSGLSLTIKDCGNPSIFKVHRFVCRSYFAERMVLCGDAAHVMSPIGGQGMNTGFADAEFLADILIRYCHQEEALNPLLQRYNRFRRTAFRVAADRAARGMWLGTRRGLTASVLRRLCIKTLLRTPLRAKLPPYFAMQTIPFKSLADVSATTGVRP